MFLKWENRVPIPKGLNSFRYLGIACLDLISIRPPTVGSRLDQRAARAPFDNDAPVARLQHWVTTPLVHNNDVIAPARMFIGEHLRTPASLPVNPKHIFYFIFEWKN